MKLNEPSSEIEIELDDKTARLAEIMAEEYGTTVEELLAKLLEKAIEDDSVFDNPPPYIIPNDPL